MPVPDSRAGLPAAIPLPVLAGLEPHPTPLDEAAVRHLFRRAGFGIAPADISPFVGRLASSVVAEIIGQAKSEPIPPEPDWAAILPPGRGSSVEERQAFNSANRDWIREMVADWLEAMQRAGVRERFALLWHNHFVTGIETYRYATLGLRYLNLLRTHALGNFRSFVGAIGIDAAMLAYLNGNTNTAAAPNENYARELMELFTMGPDDPEGVPHYSEVDIREAARALTGWVVGADLEPAFVPARFDPGDKTIFGRTGPFGYQEFLDVLFEERKAAIARFVCERLYREFVYVVPNADIVDRMAERLIADSFDLAGVTTLLLSSAHFFADEVRGARIKSPVDHLVGLFLETGGSASPPILQAAGRLLAPAGQVLFAPPNVAGWPGDHAWLNTTTLPVRWTTVDLLVRGRLSADLDVVSLARDLHDANASDAVFHLALALPGHLFAVAVDLLDVPTIDESFVGDLDLFPIPDWVQSGPPHYANLAKMLLAGRPWYEWTLDSDASESQLRSFLSFLTQLPAFQLT